MKLQPEQPDLFIGIVPVQPILPTLKQARARRDEGKARVAEKEDPAFHGQAIEALKRYFEAHENEPALIEEIRQWCEANGGPVPRNAKSWGTAVTAARVAGVVVKRGSKPARSSNLSLKWLWARP